MRRLSFRPALTLRGRQFKGLRGWAGKPLHPPLTDVPVGAYVIVAALDVISFAGQDEAWARDFFRASTFTLVAGAIVSVFTALTGFWDWLRSTEPGTQVRRTANAHALTMVTVTVIVLVSIGLRLLAYDGDSHTGVVVLVLSLVVAALTALGATLGGSLTYEYGFNVEAAADDPAWHPSETDRLPSQRGELPTRSTPEEPV